MVSVLVAFLVAGGLASAATAGGYVELDGVQYPLYPQTLTDCCIGPPISRHHPRAINSMMIGVL